MLLKCILVLKRIRYPVVDDCSRGTATDNPNCVSIRGRGRRRKELLRRQKYFKAYCLDSF